MRTFNETGNDFRSPVTEYRVSKMHPAGLHHLGELEEADNTAIQQTVTNTLENAELDESSWRAWSQVLAGHLLNYLALGVPASFGVYQLYYEETTHLPSSQISWIGSIQLFLTFATCSIAGRLADAGYCRHLVLTGCFIITSGSLLTSWCHTYWQIFCCQGLYTGLGFGLVFMPAVKIISGCFERKKSLALAVSAAGGGMGSFVFPAILQYLSPAIGFPWAVRCSAAVILVISVIAIIVIRPPPPNQKLVLDRLFDFRAISEYAYLLSTLGNFAYFIALYFGFYYINSYARNIIGFSSTKAVELLLISNAAGIPARPIAAYFADNHLGPLTTFALAIFLLGLMEFTWIAVSSAAGLYVFSIFFGFCNGATQGMFQGALASLTKDPEKMGAIFGTVMTVAGFATLSGPPIAGAFIDGTTAGIYTWAQVWAGLCLMLATAFLVACRVLKVGKRLRIRC